MSLTPAARARYQKLLTDLRDQIVQEGDVPIEPSRRDESRVGQDEDEQPLTEMQQAIASNRNRARTGSLSQIEAALQRLKDHPEEFGLCQECEEPITERRLLIVPFAELCVECQAKKDGHKGPSTRRHLRDYR